MTSTTSVALASHGAALVALVGVLREATTSQYDTPPRPSSPANDAPRPKGEHADPTMRTALHPDRMRLRATIIGAESTLARSADEFAAASRALDAALAPYRGEVGDDLAELTDAADRVEARLAVAA
ncbi:DUF7169 domain-containing protein [Agromyces kandeliae]|uniref:Uncharacterized protein n=1 Tax=Agromyces kandeliae TaxID=2666141 RepID=A0A6L5QX43_9MICO|nr:hypothetical protein [Agromyces kandeliae]MRX42350.1 hypothetical protein [Agromyces kandeliae]